MQVGRVTDERESILGSLATMVASPARLTLVLVVALILLILLSGAGVAVTPDAQFAHDQSTDGSPPSITNATAVNATAFTLTITDNHDVDEATIRASGFAAEKGSIVDATTTETGSNTTVTLFLDDPVNEENLTVAAIGNTNIADTNGNRLGADGTQRSIVVRGMDGMKPRIFSFQVSNATGGPATLEIEATEALAAFNISVGGVSSGYLTDADFDREGSSFTYSASYTPPADGTVRFTLFSYTDMAGNTRTLKFTRRITADLTPPNAQAGVDLAASRNLTLVFDGGQSTDVSGVANYSWEFGDGATATGERVEHTFDPGEYTVTLEASDPYGNAATDTVPLTLSTGSGNVTDVNESILADRRPTTITVERSGDGVGEDAVVTVDTARAGIPVSIPASKSDDGALARHGNVTLGGVNVTLATNRSFDLGVSMAGPGSVADVGTGGTRPLVGLTVVHAIPERDIDTASFSLSVNRSGLDAVEASANNLSLTRYHDGSWNRLPTTVETETNTTVALTASAPGFSRFALTADEETTASGQTDSDTQSQTDTSPSFSVTEATLSQSSVQVDQSFAVSVTVTNEGRAAGTYTAGLALNASEVARTSSPSIAPGESATIEIVHSPATAGKFEATVNGTTAGTLVVEAASNQTDANETQPIKTNSTTPTFVVTNVSLNRTAIAPGETLVVNATVRNQGSSPDFYTAGLAVNGGVVVTEESPPIPANDSRTVAMRYTFNNTGEFSLSVNGTTGGTVTVSSGGGLFAPVLGFLSALPIPTGFLQPLLLFVVAPLVVIWGILKALAIYLGY